MAIAFVKTIGTANSGTSPWTITIPAAGVAAGNHIIIAAFCSGSSVVTYGVSDSGGNTYAQNSGRDDTTGLVHSFIWSAKVTTALVSGNTITFTTSPTGNHKRVVAVEFSGLDTTTWFDVQNTGGGTSTSPSSGNLVTTGADSLLFGAGDYKNGTPGYAPADGTWTELDDAQINTAQQSGETQYKIVSAQGTYTAAGTLGSSVAWVQCGAAYKAAAGAAFTKPPGRVSVQQAVNRRYTY